MKIDLALLKNQQKQHYYISKVIILMHKNSSVYVHWNWLLQYSTKNNTLIMVLSNGIR